MTLNHFILQTVVQPSSICKVGLRFNCDWMNSYHEYVIKLLARALHVSADTQHYVYIIYVFLLYCDYFLLCKVLIRSFSYSSCVEFEARHIRRVQAQKILIVLLYRLEFIILIYIHIYEEIVQ